MQGLRPFVPVYPEQRRRADVSRRSPARAGRRRTERNEAGTVLRADAAESPWDVRAHLATDAFPAGPPTVPSAYGFKPGLLGFAPASTQG
jgi:hypothetical protein